MNLIKKTPVDLLGYDFIPSKYLPKGKNEYYLRNLQSKKGVVYRELTANEIEVLVRNRNTSDNWNNLLVTSAFSPELVTDCKFFGLVRIGKLESYYLEFHNLRRPVGLYNSTIISCDLGDNVVVDNVNYLSHYIVGNDVILVNINELATTDNAKFGNGILKQGEPETRRIWLEVCNENGGRNIIPFDGMLPGDAFIWSRFRDDELLQIKLKEFTEKEFDNRRGYYGIIGDRTVIKNCTIIKDVKIGSDAYLKGANKLKNLTINSSPEAKSQIGEGCELVNGIIGEGCRIFYGVKAVRFILSSHSQLKYGARLINSFLGNNSTISCCEVLNSLIFPAHEQHHNNSFLCASLVMGQTNMAAGATIGSNHNSRGSDGELIAGRGFWPGLCVSLKHNSQFASFIILEKGDYPSELNIPLPFSLVSNQVSRDELVVMPGYWFLHNMYALARNSWKYIDRDKRTDKSQLIEYEFLAPDSINEIIASLSMLERFTANAYVNKFEKEKKYSEKQLLSIGKNLLESRNKVLEDLEILADGFEHSKRKVKIIKAVQAYHLFKDLIIQNAVTQLKSFINSRISESYAGLQKSLESKPVPSQWVNVGGQLIQQTELNKMIKQVHTGKIKTWAQIHRFYLDQGQKYAEDKLNHSLAALLKVHGINLKTADKLTFRNLLNQSISIKEWMTKAIDDSRAKDYTNDFRKMVYSSPEEMNAVLGRLEDNSFIRQEIAALNQYKKEIKEMIRKLKL